MRMGGIAGGLEMQYVGVADFEVLLPTGDVHTFQEQCLINEDLPDSLFSPQAFLSHQANKGKEILDPDKFLQLYEDESDDDSSQQSNDEHFRIFHNRAEWHKDNKLLLTLNYDRCFLPRIALHRKGTSLSTAKALYSALESKISNPTLDSSNSSSILDSSNKNLSPLKRHWSLWHMRLGHISFERIQ